MGEDFEELADGKYREREMKRMDTDVFGTFFDIEDAAVGDFDEDDLDLDYLEQEGGTGTRTVTILDKSKVLKQSNRLVVARYRLTKHEQRLIIAICSQIDKNAKKFDTVRVRAGDIADFCNFKGKDKYNQVHSTILKLMTRTLQIQKDDGRWYVTHWLQSADYLDGGIIEYCIDERLKPELLQLKSAYLSSNTGHLMQFRRDYSARLYFMLKKMSKVGEFEYTLDFIRDRFQLEKGYRLFSNIRNRILEPALQEINEKSDISVSHSYIKEGRAVKRIRFIVKEKIRKNDVETSAFEDAVTQGGTGDIEDNISKEEKEIFARITNPDKWNIGSDMAKKLINEFGVERVRSNVLYCDKHRAGKHNLGGFLVEMIRMDAAEDEKQRMTEKKREDEKQKRRNESILKDILNMNGGTEVMIENSKNNNYPADKVEELKRKRLEIERKIKAQS